MPNRIISNIHREARIMGRRMNQGEEAYRLSRRFNYTKGSEPWDRIVTDSDAAVKSRGVDLQ